jgi:hypothetical protein
MRGFIFRLGVWVKERGERIGHVKVHGVFILGWLAGPIIVLGLKIKGLA